MAAAVFRFAIGLAIAATACTSVPVGGRGFEGTRWHVTAVNGRPTPATGDYRIEFSKGEIGGRFGCNSFGGRVAVRGEVMTAGPIMATQMGCSEPAAYFESAGIAILQQPMRWQWTAGLRMTLSNSAGTIALERLP